MPMWSRCASACPARPAARPGSHWGCRARGTPARSPHGWASLQVPPTGWAGGLLCTVAIFLPGALLVVGTLPYWESLRRNRRAQAALAGVNAAVVGLLLAALWQPVWVSAVHGPLDIVLVGLALVALMVWKLPPWLVVLASGMAGWAAGMWL